MAHRRRYVRAFCAAPTSNHPWVLRTHEPMLQSDVQRSPFTVLLVEDNADHAELTRRCLDKYRMDVRMVHLSNGEAALDYLHQRADYADPADAPMPDVILLDLRLPGIDGLAVLEEVRATEALAMIPVIILTTSKAQQDMSGAYDRYANSYVLKPLDYERFSALMEDLLHYWVAWNNYPRIAL